MPTLKTFTTSVLPFYFACALKRKLHLRFRAAYLIVVGGRVTAYMWLFGILRSSTFKRWFQPAITRKELCRFHGKSISPSAMTSRAVRAVLRCELICVK